MINDTTQSEKIQKLGSTKAQDPKIQDFVVQRFRI